MMTGRKRERKFWSRMLLSYLVITLLCFLLYIAFVLMGSWRLGVAGYELERSDSTSRAQRILTEKVNVSLEIFNRINWSTDFTRLYLDLVEGDRISTAGSNQPMNAIINAYVRNVYRGVDDVALFLDGADFALAASGLVELSQPFDHMSFPTTYVTVGSIADLVGIDSVKASFNTENLLFATSFRYQGGLERGVIVVSFSLDRLVSSLRTNLDEEAFELIFNNHNVLSVPSVNGVEALDWVSLSDQDLPTLALSIGFVPFSFLDSIRSHQLALWLGVGLAFYLFMTALSIFFTIRHSRPLKLISSLVPEDERKVGRDEVEAIVASLKDIVVGYDEYRSGIADVAPLLEGGIMHELVAGDRARLDERHLRSWLGFSRPYYFVIALNLESGERDDYEALSQALERLKASFTTDERSVSVYRRDRRNYFLTVNLDSEEGQEAIVESVFSFLSGSLGEDALLTFGVDMVRGDMSDFALACNAALSALDYMLVRGKGEVYYSEDGDGEENDYFIPSNYEVTLARTIREGEDCDALLDSLLKVNLMKHNLNAAAVRDLSNEIYYSLCKVCRMLSLDSPLHRADSESTVEDMFAFYKQSLEAMKREYLDRQKGADDAYSQLRAYVDANFTDPSLSLGLLAERFHLSTKTVTNHYYRHYGVTYLKYVTHLRVEKAKGLLVSTSDPIDAIAVAVGYSNTLSFRRNFKEETGLAPSEWRLANS